MAFRLTNRGMAFRLPDKHAARHERVEVRAPVQKPVVGLDGGDRAGRHVVVAKPAAGFLPNTRPDARAELAQQLADLRVMHPELGA